MRCWLLIYALYFLAGSASLATEVQQKSNPAIAALELQLQIVSGQLDSLLTSRQDIIKQADDLAAQIAQLRGKESMSQTEHRLLETDLRESQSLRDRILTNDQRQIDLAANKELLIDQLILLLEQDIELLLRQGETSNSDQQTRATIHLQTLLTKKNTWEACRSPKNETVTVFPVLIDAADSPRQLRIKGDILSDQESAIRLEITAVDARVTALAEEMHIRQKVAELASDLEFFNEQEELLDRIPLAANAGDFESMPVENENDASGSRLSNGDFPDESIGTQIPEPTDQTEHWFFPGISEAMNAPAPRSPVLIQEWIEKLERHRTWMQTQADSLKEQSSWFYYQAEEKAD